MLEKTFEQRFPITYKVDDAIITLEELLLADANRGELPKDYYDELNKVIEQLKTVSEMINETEMN
jgi:hypothetical protein